MSERNGHNKKYLRTLIIVALIGDFLGILPWLFPRGGGDNFFYHEGHEGHEEGF